MTIGLPRRAAGFFLALGCGLLLAGADAPAGELHAQQTGALQLGWSKGGIDASGTNETFVLRNAGSAAFPATGWSLYFNAIAGAVSLGGTEAPAVTRITGTLFALTPGAGSRPIEPTRSATLVFRQPEPLMKLDKGPMGPFLVFDDEPDHGYPLSLDIAREAAALPLQDEASLARRFDALARLPLPPDALPPVFPPPRRARRAPGDDILITGRPFVVVRGYLPRAQLLSLGLLDDFWPLSAADPASSSTSITLNLNVDPALAGTSPEAYVIRVGDSSLAVTGASERAVLCGLQSLRQLLHRDPGTRAVRIQRWTIEDAPRFAYRGFQMDVARNFHGVDEMLRLIDRMARLHLNVLHLHVADDEGWRLEIPALPELVSVGARRGYSTDALAMLPPAYGSGPEPGRIPGSGYWSVADFERILRAAWDRGIQVIPEMEMPGHARAAIVAMKARAAHRRAQGDPDPDQDRLDEPADQSVYHSAQGYSDNVIDPVAESSFHFIDQVVGAVAAMYAEADVPFERLHVGGDEVPGGAWEHSPDCLRWLAQHPGASKAELWAGFYRRVGDIVAHHGARLAGWEELGLRITPGPGGILNRAPDAAMARRKVAVIFWNSLGEGAHDLAYRLANAGVDTVLAPADRLYLDMSAGDDAGEPGVDWAGSGESLSGFDFVPEDLDRKEPFRPSASGRGQLLSKAGRAHLIGIESTLFTETVRTEGRTDYLLWPRLFGVAERAWSPAPAWAKSAARADSVYFQDLARYDAQLGCQVIPDWQAREPEWQFRIPPPGLKRDTDGIHVAFEWPCFDVHYTDDGSDPVVSSPVAHGIIPATGRVRAAAFSPSGQRGRIAQLEVTP